MYCVLCEKESDTRICEECMKAYNFSGDPNNPDVVENNLTTETKLPKTESALFSNVGLNIKKLVRVLTYLSIFICIVACAIFIWYVFETQQSIVFVPVALVACAFGIMISILFGWFLYGYGEIIDMLKTITKNTKNNQ